MPNRLPAGDTDVRIDAEISERIDGRYEVVARPRFFTKLGVQGVITSRTDTHDVRLELIVTKAN